MVITQFYLCEETYKAIILHYKIILVSGETNHYLCLSNILPFSFVRGSFLMVCWRQTSKFFVSHVYCQWCTYYATKLCDVSDCLCKIYTKFFRDILIPYARISLTQSHTETRSTFSSVPSCVNIHNNFSFPNSDRIFASQELVVADFLHNF